MKTVTAAPRASILGAPIMALFRDALGLSLERVQLIRRTDAQDTSATCWVVETPHPVH